MFVRVLRCFELISGLQKNFNKSSIMGVNVHELFIQFCADFIRCKVEKLPITYLGAPLSLKCLLISVWSPLVLMFQNRLASMKGNFLSYGVDWC